MGARVAFAVSRLNQINNQSEMFSAFLLQAPAFGKKNLDTEYLNLVNETAETEPKKILSPTHFTPPNEDYTFLSEPYADDLIYLGPFQALT